MRINDLDNVGAQAVYGYYTPLCRLTARTCRQDPDGYAAAAAVIACTGSG